MTLQIRRGQCGYLTRTVRRDGRRIRIYVASGKAAIEEHQKDREKQNAEQLRQTRERAVRDRFRAARSESIRFADMVRVMLTASMFRFGYRRYNRGHWKRIKWFKDRGPVMDISAVDARPSSALLDPVERMRELSQRADRGDAGALIELRELLEQQPEIWRQLGDIGAGVRHSWLIQLSENQAIRDAVCAKLSAMQRALADEGNSSLERLLAERIITTWLEIQVAEHRYSTMPPGTSIAQASFLLKAKDSAEKRHAESIRSLAGVRKLLPSAPDQPRLTIVDTTPLHPPTAG